MTVGGGVQTGRLRAAATWGARPCGGDVEGSPPVWERGGNFSTNREARSQMVQEAGA